MPIGAKHWHLSAHDCLNPGNTVLCVKKMYSQNTPCPFVFAQNTIPVVFVTNLAELAVVIFTPSIIKTVLKEQTINV